MKVNEEQTFEIKLQAIGDKARAKHANFVRAILHHFYQHDDKACNTIGGRDVYPSTS